MLVDKCHSSSWFMHRTLEVSKKV